MDLIAFSEGDRIFKPKKCPQYARDSTGWKVNISLWYKEHRKEDLSDCKVSK